MKTQTRWIIWQYYFSLLRATVAAWKGKVVNKNDALPMPVLSVLGLPLRTVEPSGMEHQRRRKRL